jgi:PKD repeat protein/photosystem II stability/assembly factor-like uncharacterized protein
MKQHKLFVIITVLFLLTEFGIQQSLAQSVTDSDNYSESKDWLRMIQDPNVNFFEAQSSFYKYWAHRKDYKGNGYKVFKRWEYINETRVLPDGKLPSPEHVMSEFNKYMAGLDKPLSSSGNWSIIGPTSYPINNTGQPTGMGRINAIAFHPTDVNTIYIGSPSGGIWKTTNGGASWENLANNLPKLGVSSILIHPVDPNIIYIGTGDRDGGDAPGIGVFKSTNGGSTWTQINNTMGNVIVGDMLMHPSDPNTILAATSGGIFKTTNGGATWALKSGAYNFKDIEFKPGDPSVVYAVRITTPSRFYRSANTGDSWTQITSGIPTTNIGSRMVIGTSPANPSYVYLVQIQAADETFANLLRSVDAGLSFTTMSNTPNIFDYSCDGSGTASQATYDLCINVDPNDANTLYVGSINTWKSVNGGTSWTISTVWAGNCFGTASSVHADHHVFARNPLNGNLYLGHDGGISYTADAGGNWTEITGGLPISQLYRLGQGASNSNYTLIGLQDNGSAATLNGSTFYTTRGGDGTECLIDYSNSNYCYNTYVQGDISRSVTGPSGSYSLIASTGTNGIGYSEIGAWITPYLLNKSNASVMFAGYQNVFRCDNVKASPASSVVFTAISSGETATCKMLEQSTANPDILYVFRSDATVKLKRSDNANASAASVTWNTCSMPDGYQITDIETHPSNQDIVYVTSGTNIFKSSDKGLTWTNMDPNGSLPDLTINTLVYDKNSNEGIYIGNQLGVWFKDATMTDWILFSNGLPPVDVRELEIFYDPVGTQNRLKAATYGRGLWQSDLHESGVLNPTNFTAVVSGNNLIDLSWALASGNNVVLAVNSSPTFGTPVNGSSYTTSSTIPGGGTVIYNGNSTSFNHSGLTAGSTYYYKIWSYDGSSSYSGGTTANATTTISIASFTSNVNISCSGSLTVNFTDASTAAYNSWAWDVDNDGVTDYTTQNPVHTYNSPGLYSVRLTINSGAAELVKENLILVMSTSPTANTGCTLTSNGNTGNGYGIGIYRFALGNIDYTTSNNDGYYNNYVCSAFTPLELNKTYTVTVRTGTANNEGARVYIDYNDNGIFESGESVVSFPANKEGTRSLTFTTPSTGVAASKGLRLRVLSKFGSVPSNACDISSYGQAEDYTVYFVTDATWAGSVSSDWNTAGNWSYNTVPGAGVKVILPAGAPHYPVLTSDLNCQHLTIRAGAMVTVNPSVALTVNGVLYNQAGQSGLIIKSNETGTGSLIHSTANVAATFERYMNDTEWNNWVDGWHFLSSPVINQSISPNFTTEPFDFYTWYEAQNLWVNIKNTTVSPTWDEVNGGGGFIPGTGYMAAYDEPGVKLFQGILNVNSVTKSNLNITGSTQANRSWHLLGNPFSSALSWDGSSAWSLQNIGGVAKIWNEQNQSYSDVSSIPSGIIPATNGFMVQVMNGTGSLVIPASQRVHSLQPFYKSSNPMLNITVKNNLNGSAQESRLIFSSEATAGFDFQYDGEYLQGYGPAFYSNSGELNLSTNALPVPAAENRIPFSFIPNEGEFYTFTASGMESFSESLYLYDLKLDLAICLTTQPVYHFSSDAGDNPKRFILTFSPTGVDNLESTLANAWISGDILYINTIDEYSKAEIIDMRGRVVQTIELKGRRLHHNQVKLATGAYVLRITGNGKVLTSKIIK